MSLTTIVVNAAAYTAVDQAESEPDIAMSINGIAPGILAEEANRSGAFLIHYSTDYVFDGMKRSPYVEIDKSNPLNVYGNSKLVGDMAIQQSGCSYAIFRLCWVYGHRGTNFLRKILSLVDEHKQLRIVSDQIGSPTWSRMIAEVTALSLYRILIQGKTREFRGVYNLSSAGQTSWHGFAERIVALKYPEYYASSKIQAVATAEYPTASKRPAYSVMSCEKLKNTFEIQLPDWQDSLRQVIELL